MFEAAAREFREECCATLGTVEILGFKEHFRYGMHYFMVYVHAGYYIGKIKNGIPKKSGPWQWRDIKKVCNTSLLTKCTEPFDMLQKALMLSSTKARAMAAMQNIVQREFEYRATGVRHPDDIALDALAARNNKMEREG